MGKSTRRGYVSTDEKEFNIEAIDKLKCAGTDIIYLLDKGYNIKGASTFVGDHYLLSARQRMALVRMIASNHTLKYRMEKEIKENLLGKTVNVDGFNTIITLEVALSESLILKGMDGAMRDLAGLRGTYRLIDKTDQAIVLMGEELERLKPENVNLYLDAPVSNSGRLKVRMYELLHSFSYNLNISCVNQVDKILEHADCVISSDSIILDKCVGWVNLNGKIIHNSLPDAYVLDLELNK